MGVGLIACNSMGQVRVSLCHYMPYLTDATTTEAFAAHQGVELCRSIGFNAVILKGDAEVVVNALMTEGNCSSSYDSIIADTRMLMNSIQQWQEIKFDPKRKKFSRPSTGMHGCKTKDFSGMV